jgi:hypothetical protein
MFELCLPGTGTDLAFKTRVSGCNDAIFSFSDFADVKSDCIDDPEDVSEDCREYPRSTLVSGA